MADQEYKNLVKSGGLAMEPEPVDGGRTLLNLVQVRINRTRKVAWHVVEELPLSPGDLVVVETERGTAGGEVLAVAHKQWVSKKRYRRVLRLQETSPKQWQRSKFDSREGQAKSTCSALVAQLKLDMKIVDVEYVHWENRTIFYFVADGRVDFRELVKELSRSLRCRIEMRQIGPRDETKMLGGLGRCGREHCCSTFLSEFRSVRTKMAKEQGLVVNQEKITGHCRKLLCCLAYERETYTALRKNLPPLGTILQTADGDAKVIELMVIRQEVKTIIRGVDGFRYFGVNLLSINDDGEWVLDIKTLERQKQEALEAKMRSMVFATDSHEKKDYSKGDSSKRSSRDGKGAKSNRRRGGARRPSKGSQDKSGENRDKRRAKSSRQGTTQSKSEGSSKSQGQRRNKRRGGRGRRRSKGGDKQTNPKKRDS